MRCHTLDMRTQAALRPIIATALVHRAPLRMFADGRSAQVGRQARRRQGGECRALASGARTHASLRDRAHHRHRRRGAEDHRHQGRHAHRHRAPLQRGLRRNRARQSGRRSVAAGREPRDRHPFAVHPAQRAARGHRHQCRGDATLLLPEGEEGRAAGRAHLSHRHRQGGLEDAGRGNQDRSSHQGSGVASRRRRSSPSTRRTTIRCRPSCPRVPTIRSAAMRSISAGPRT